MFSLYSASLDGTEATAVAGMEHCQVEINALTQQANDEILKVEQRFNKLRKPAYIKRSNHIKKISGFWATVVSSFFVH